MIYLDYSATTPVNKEVLDTFNKVCLSYIGNPNSLHKLGGESKKLIDASTKQIADILNVKSDEIIYTSGASEANNTAIKGIAFRYQNRGHHIITTKLEHSSVKKVMDYLSTLGFEIEYASLDKNGCVDLEKLKSSLRKDTILVSIASVNSELGIRQDLKAIKKILEEYPKIIFHSDMTQSIGKEKVDLKYVDLASVSAQKFYGLKGSGFLYKREKIEIEPLIHGGKSTTIYRSGTPCPSHVASLAKALRLVDENIVENRKKVEQLSLYLLDKLKSIENIHINSNAYCLPHIVNVSIKGVKPETMLHALEQEDIYVSTQSACSSHHHISDAVYAVTNNLDYATSSIRISLSHLTTKEEIDTFIKVFKEKVTSLTSLSK